MAVTEAIKEKKEGWTAVATVVVETVLSPNTPITQSESMFDGADQRVSMRLGRDRKRILSISLVGEKPEFTFEGMWSGKDVLVVQRHLRKAYFQYTRQMRREKLATTNQTGG